MLMEATWAGRESDIRGASGLLAACSIALGSGRHGPLHCLNCGLTLHSGRAWAVWECGFERLSSRDQAWPWWPLERLPVPELGTHGPQHPVALSPSLPVPLL